MTTWNMTPGDWRYVTMAGLRLQATPEGDCREGSFIAHGQGVGLTPLQAVQIAVDGTPLFYGEIRVGGNSKDVDGHQFTLRSLALRLKEVVIPAGWSSPQQNAGITVRSLIEAVLPQLGGSMTIGTIELPFNCRAIINANQQNPYALLEQIAADGAGMGGDYRFGVNANKEFFFVPRNTSSMALTGNLTSNTKWTGPVAENPVTAVLWYVAKKSDGSWLTHLSQSDSVPTYGMRVKPVSLTSSEGVWITADMNLTVSDGANVDTWTLEKDANGNLITSHDLNAVKPRLTNGKSIPGSENYTVARIFLNPAQNANELALTMTTNAQRLVIGSEFGFVGDIPNSDGSSNTYRNDTWAALTLDGQAVGQVASGGESQYIGQFAAAKLALNLNARPTPIAYWSASMWLMEFRAERLNTELLDRLANFHYNVPAASAGEVEATGLTLGRGGNSTWGQVAAIEYRITADDGICTALMIGQPDDPGKLAQAELIKARDQKSVITAITSST